MTRKEQTTVDITDNAKEPKALTLAEKVDAFMAIRPEKYSEWEYHLVAAYLPKSTEEEREIAWEAVNAILTTYRIPSKLLGVFLRAFTLHESNPCVDQSKYRVTYLPKEKADLEELRRELDETKHNVGRTLQEMYDQVQQLKLTKFRNAGHSDN